MGGHLAIGIRRANGTEYISQRHTNPLPHWLVDPEFWSDGAVVDEYIKSGLSEYTPVGRIFPDEYGVVLIDFVTKRIFSRQDYCGILDFNCSGTHGDDARHVLAIIERGWVKRYEVWRHWDNDAERDAKLADRDLHPDEVDAFIAIMRANAESPTDYEDVRTWPKRFEPGMVSVEFVVPGWTVDDGKPRDANGMVTNCSFRAWQVWSEVEAFVKETGWKAPCWSQAEVDAEFKQGEEDVA
jgi:hypothetical protein